MSEEIETNIQKEILPEENTIIEKDILNSDFFSFFEKEQKLPEKRAKIINLINYFQENKTYIQSLKDSSLLEKLYDIILSNLIENNNNFVMSQINIIKIISEQITLNNIEEIRNNFVIFFKKALPKLFDKFYLQNEKINKLLLDLFILVLNKNILKFSDYFPLIENICIEEDDEYKINILNLILYILNNDDKINKEEIPINIINTIEQLKENERLKELAGNIIKILDERKKEENDIENYSITNLPLSQQDSKLVFSSFIKKISKAVREENLNKNKEKKELEIKIEEDNKDAFEEKKIINEIIIEQKNNKEKEKEKEENNKDNNNKELSNEINKKEINEENKEKEKKVIINTKENKNKKIIKNRITRSRKLGAMIKNKPNKEKEQLKEENKTDNNDIIPPKEIIEEKKEIKQENNKEEIPINNPQINSEEENGIIIKKLSMDDFNKKIDSALEQEQEQINKENNESNNDEKIEKEKDDSKFNEIKLILGSDICDSFSSQKWENKKHALEQINILIKENNIKLNTNDLFNYIKSKMKNFKETNFNIIREAFNIFITLLKKGDLSKDNLILLINIYYEKIGDVKLKENFIELINTAIEESIIDSSSVINNIISKISKKKNIKILNEYSNLFIKLIEENNNIKDLPINDIINYCKLMAGNSNPQVRTSATNLICTLYKYLGEDLKPLLKDIKESTLKMIEAELDKVTIIDKKELNKKFNTKKIIKKNSGIKQSNGELNLIEPENNIINSGPIDISKKINPYLKDLSEGKWSEKKEALENIENILIETNNRILPSGLNDFFNIMKNKLSDSNKNLVKLLISLLNKFISSLKKEFKPWSKMIALSLIPNLSDKNQLIRNECQMCFETWVENIGIESLVIYFPQFLKNENVEIRIEVMNFIKKYNKYFSKNLAENIYKELIEGLLICLQDRSNNVRNEAEDIIILSLDYIDIDLYYKKIKDFKPVIEKDLKQILDNILLQKNSEEISSYKTLNIKEKIKNSFKSKKSGDKNTNMNLSNLALNDNDKLNYNSDYMSVDEDLDLNIKNIKEKNSALNASNIKRKKHITKTAEKEKYKKSNSKIIKESNNKEGTLASNSTVLRSHKNLNNSTEKKVKINRRYISNKNKTINQIFNLSNNNKIHINKIRRLELDKKFKFSIDTISKDDISKLKEFSKIIFIEEFSTKIFENNLNKEIDFFNRIKGFLESKENLNVFFDNMDIILKIISLKINHNYNPALIKHFFDLMENIYNLLSETGYELNEIESSIILCLLIDKLSINNIQIKENSVNLIKDFSNIIDLNKTFLEVLNFALNKNNKVKNEVLDMTLDFHLNKKINMTSKDYIKILSKYLSINDKKIKSKCYKIFKGLEDFIKEEISDKEKNIFGNNLINSDEEDNSEDNGEEYNEENKTSEEIYDNNKYNFNSENKINYKNNEINLNKFYLSEDRYHNIEQDENYYTKTDNKEDKENNPEKPLYYKNSEIISKIQKIKSIKQENNINDNSEIKPRKSGDKFSLPKRIIVKQKKNNNENKKLKVFNNNLNKSQNIKQKFKTSSSNKNLNYKGNNINNNYINNNIINNYYNNNFDNGNSINNDNNGNNNDISISLYNDININSIKSIDNIPTSSVFTEKDLLEIMNNLFSEDESEKMGTIIIIHEILCSKYQQNKYILIPNIDNIIKIMIQITHELFLNIENLSNKIIPLKFTKYLATILCKITSNKELIIHISYKVLYDLCFELLSYLLINGLDKIGSNQEGNIIFKSLNSAMLRVLENCETTSVILALLEIIKQEQNNTNSNLLCNLAMKCLFKVTKNVNDIVNKIQLDKILFQMHLLTYNFDKVSNGKETNSQSNIMIIKFIKNFIIDMAKIKKEEILEDYNKSVANNQYKDKYIYNWIMNTLETLEYNEKEDKDELSKSINIRSSSTNMNKNRIINNSDKKKENGGFNLDEKKSLGNNNSINNLSKKSVIIVKKHANNSINNRYNNINNNFNTQSGINITATKSSILGSSNISNNNKINIQKNINKNTQIYTKGGIKAKKKFNK